MRVHLQERLAWRGLTLGWVLLVVTAHQLAGCGDPFVVVPQACAPGEVAREGGGCEPRKPCAPGELTLESGECRPAGLPPDMQCPPGELALANGGCQPAGVPPEACAEGFVPDGSGGCEAILPAEACPAGLMAIPGEMTCREVAPCGDGPWGSIPVEASTQFVNQAYTGGESDGSAARPWTRVQDGVDAAEDGAIVAVTDGTYVEDVVIQDKAARLWGRCPGRVEVHGTGVSMAAVVVNTSAADGTEIRGLSATGAKNGIIVYGASDVAIESVWVHDAGDRGVEVGNLDGPTSLALTGSLIEQNHQVGVFVAGSHARIEGTAVRSTQPLNERYGWGIMVQEGEGEDERADVGIRACLVEQNHGAGVFLRGADAEIEATVVRATQPVNGQFGQGIVIQSHPEAGERGDVSVRASLVEQNHDVGVFVAGSEAEIEATVVRATQPVNGQFGRGIVIQGDPDTGEHANASVRACLVEQNHDVGIFVADAHAEIDATVVRSTEAIDGRYGVGIRIQTNNGDRADANVRSCLVEQNHQAGITVSFADATIEGTIVRDTTADSDGSAGDGIAIENGTTTIRGGIVAGNARAGIASWGSEVRVISTIITCNTLDVNGETLNGIRASFDGSSDWLCSRSGAEGCAETDTCSVVSTSIAPPPPIAPLDPA